MINCNGAITGAGFETPAEILYLQKTLMCIPIKGQHEQKCNGAVLKDFGVLIAEDADKNLKKIKIEMGKILKSNNFHLTPVQPSNSAKKKALAQAKS